MINNGDNENVTSDKYLAKISLIIIFGAIIGGCISTKNDITELRAELDSKINNADNYTKRIIFKSIDKTDKSIIKYISSLNIVSEVPCEHASGCTINNFTSDGRLIRSDIYLLHPSAYKDSCETFEHALYHELGHIVYFYRYGNYDVDLKDEIYQQSIESYAEKYADNRSTIQKEGCNKEITEQLKRDFKEKEKIYQYAVRIMSKWDIYGNDIPLEMRDEYKHDYNLYEEARKEYNTALDQYKNYMIKVQDNKNSE